jgi:hypothetical protein
MYDEYDEYEEDYPPQRRGTLRRRFPLQWKWPVLALLVLVLVSLRFCGGGPQREHTGPPRKQTVKVVSWQTVDVRIRASAISAREKAVRYAEDAVGRWVATLKADVEDEFLPWYFSYWNQNGLAWKTVGWRLADTAVVEFVTGDKPAARDRLERVVADSFAARVLRPESARLTAERITRETIQVSLTELSKQLAGLQAEFEVPVVEWQRHLQQMSRLALAIEGNRQVPLVGKALIAGTGVAATKLAASLSVHIRDLVLRAGGRKLLGSGAGVVGKTVGRGLGWWAAAGTVIFEFVDHRRTVSRNEPVLRRSLNGYVDNLGEQLLYDSQSGVVAVLDGVQTEVLAAVEDVEGRGKE